MIVPTPLVQLPCLGKHIYGKVEFLHPSGSMKHRSIPKFVDAALVSGAIRPGSELVIRSAGAAAITTAWVASRRELACTAVLPESAPAQVVRTLRWFGATVHCLDNARALAMLEELAALPNTYALEQASEPELREHYRIVAAEILDAAPQTAAIVAGLGTGLSAMGLAAEVSARGADCRVYGVEPLEAPIATGGSFRPHKIPGLAPPRERPLLDVSRLAGVENIPSAEAWDVAQFVAKREGIFLGPSSGATAAAAMRLAERHTHGPIVAICACAMHEYIELAP